MATAQETGGAAPVAASGGGFDRAAREVLQASHLLAPHQLPDLVTRTAAGLGALEAVVFLVDLQQTSLVPFFGSADAGERSVHALPVEGSLAGLAFQRVQVLTQPHDEHSLRVWLPLLDGSERLGVLGVVMPQAEGAGGTSRTVGADPASAVAAGLPGELTAYATLVAELVMTKTMYGDSIVLARRTAAMGLAAGMQWGLLPPLTFAGQDVVVAAALEPAYEVAGDSVDYAVDEGRVRFAVFDGMGHGLRSAQMAVLAVTAYRHARRSGRSLTATATAHIVDSAIHDVYGGDAFVTALLAELDTDTGLLSWVSAGHPEPVLVRDGRIVKHLHADPRLPLGLGAMAGATSVTVRDAPDPAVKVPAGEAAYPVSTEQLQPGDQIVAFTDGVTEAPSPAGDRFGEDRLVELLTRHMASGLPAPETMRRIVKALLDHQQGQLTDDATLLLLTWRAEPGGTLM